MSALGVVVLVSGLLVFFVALIVVMVKAGARRAARIEAELREELGDDVRRIATVQGLGLRSAGRGQIRGTGTLVLTPDDLRFRQWVPNRETASPSARSPTSGGSGGGSARPSAARCCA